MSANDGGGIDVFAVNSDDDVDNDEAITVDFGSAVRGIQGISS